MRHIKVGFSSSVLVTYRVDRNLFKDLATAESHLYYSLLADRRAEIVFPESLTLILPGPTMVGLLEQNLFKGDVALLECSFPDL